MLFAVIGRVQFWLDFVQISGRQTTILRSYGTGCCAATYILNTLLTPLVIFPDEIDAVRSLAFSPDGRRAVLLRTIGEQRDGQKT